MVTASAADKAFQSGDFDQAAIKLEAQIKQDAGAVTKPVSALRQQAADAFQKRDFRTGMLVLGQLAAARQRDPRNPSARRQGKDAAARSRLDRRLYRLSTRERPHRRSRQPGAARPHFGRP